MARRPGRRQRRGADRIDQPAGCILDENVALALQKTCGWTSLPLKGWLAPAYQRYAILLGMWVDQHDLGRRDSIERWLFEEGKRVRRSRSGAAP
jgi:hypothetical protein